MRIETIGNATLYLGDCLEILPTLGKVDAVVTDPPYGIGVDRTMERQSGRKFGKAAAHNNTYESSGWDDQPCLPEIIAKMREISQWQIIFGGNYFELPPTTCWLVWDKMNGENNFADCELAWTNLQKAVRIVHWQWKGMIRKGKEERFHPTQKPIGMMEWCIRHLPDDTKTILDPFLGSGTTGIAAIHLGRKFIGIEISEKYFDISCRRIEAAHRQGVQINLLDKPAKAKPITNLLKG